MRLRLKTKLVLAISAMVVALVTTLSSIYVSQIIHQRLDAEYSDGEFVAYLILHSAQEARVTRNLTKCCAK